MATKAAKEPSTLSEHLLRESERFCFFPQRYRRSRLNLAIQREWERVVGRIIEWRKTFAPGEPLHGTELLMSSGILDEFYCRDWLRGVSGQVDRTRALAHFTLAEISDPGAFVSLREAANCYIAGFGIAAVALSRAGMEGPLRKSVSKHLGKTRAGDDGLFDMLQAAERLRLLSKVGLDRAHRVRKAGDTVLHKDPKAQYDPLAILEDAKRVVLELESRR